MQEENNNNNNAICGEGKVANIHLFYLNQPQQDPLTFPSGTEIRKCYIVIEEPGAVLTCF